MSILDNLFKSAQGSIKSAVNKEVRNAKNTAVQGVTNAVVNAAVNSQKAYSFAYLPESLSALTALPGADLHDPCAVAAFTVLALCEFPKNRDACCEMLNYLKGPRPLTPMEIGFIRDRFMDGVDYVPRSYLEGTSPANNYTPSVPYTVVVKEFAHSRDNFKDGYLRLWIRSSGADTERFVDLRYKPSTDQWFLWEFGGMLSGIRIPVSQDVWA